MTPFLVLNLQSTFTLVAKWHIAPRLSKSSVEDYLVLLTWVHVFRYAPLTLFVPTQASPTIPAGVAEQIAYGDLVSAVLALVAVVFLTRRWPGAIAVAWLFNIVGIADLVVSTSAAIRARLYEI